MMKERVLAVVNVFGCHERYTVMGFGLLVTFVFLFAIDEC